MGLFATAVTVITTRTAAGGCTGSRPTPSRRSRSFPRSSSSVSTRRRRATRTSRSKCFIINILSEHQEELSARFAKSGGDKFTGVAYQLGRLGTPVLDGTLGHVRVPDRRTHEGATTSFTSAPSARRVPWRRAAHLFSRKVPAGEGGIAGENSRPRCPLPIAAAALRARVLAPLESVRVRTGQLICCATEVHHAPVDPIRTRAWPGARPARLAQNRRRAEEGSCSRRSRKPRPKARTSARRARSTKTATRR